MKRIGLALRPPKRPAPVSAPALAPIDQYLASGRQPWSPGYWEYRQQFVETALQDEALMERFRQGGSLPEGYGIALDERVVEYPWVFARLAAASGRLLDAGATLNYPFLHARPALAARPVVVYTLEPDGAALGRGNVSYIYGDLRDTILKDECFESIVCISTLEHIGLDNTLIYTADDRFREMQPGDFSRVLSEFRRLLVKGGRLLLTVPYGLYQNLGWLQQFDEPLLQQAIQAFGGQVAGLSFFRYLPAGWQSATPDECAECRYFDIHHASGIDPDQAAAARAVACVELIKTG